VEDRHTGLVVAEIRIMDCVAEPQMRHSHSVLRQRASLIRTDCRRRTQSLDGLEVLHQTVLARHTLGSAGQTNLDTQTTLTFIFIFIHHTTGRKIKKEEKQQSITQSVY